jgi:zinc transport system substrate-binding protein
VTNGVVEDENRLEVGKRTTVVARTLLVVVLLLALLGAAGCRPSASGEKLKVVATIFPLADFVKNVAGDKVDVITLLRPGDSPHTYEPTSRDMKAVAQATLLVVNGAGLDFWVENLKAAASDNMVVVDTSAVLAEEGLLLTGDEHDDGGTNPHFWLDPVLAQKQVEAIAAALVAADPDNKDFYLENAADYIAQLQSLDEEIKSITQLFSSREFITFHPAWTYFASRYGLTEAAVIEEAPGKAPTIDDIKRIVDAVRDLKARAIFAEPQFSTQAADAIAADSGAEVLLLDPIGGADLPGRDSYIALMRYNVGQMGEAMQ